MLRLSGFRVKFGGEPTDKGLDFQTGYAIAFPRTVYCGRLHFLQGRVSPGFDAVRETEIQTPFAMEPPCLRFCRETACVSTIPAFFKRKTARIQAFCTIAAKQRAAKCQITDNYSGI
jgi:hypothetical protein